MLSFIKKFKKVEVALALAVFAAAIISLAGFRTACEDVRRDVLRLHVIANSDSEEDQALKLKIRDTILKEGAAVFDGTLTADEAAEVVKPETARLREAAERTAAENGYGYKVDVEVGEEYFDTRVYENFTMPAGRYMSVRVIIGEGKGKNWWCVMFPPLCLPAAGTEHSIDAFLDDDEVRVVESSPRYEPRFKIVEIIEKVRDKWF